MKKSIILTAAAALMMTACDVIEPNDRLTPTDEYPQSNRVVLVEEYTGHRCVNCPDGAEVIKDMIKLSGNKVIPVSIHCGPFSSPTPSFPNDFRTAVGNEYEEHFNPEYFPSIQINRNGKINSSIKTWVSDLIAEAWQSAPANIYTTCDYNPDTREIKIETTITSLQDLNSDTSLQLWILESGIIGKQRSNDGDIENYEHNHVLRDAINGTWGESIGLLNTGDEKTIRHTYKVINENWDIANCTIVAFIFDTEKGNVLQASEVNILNK